MAKRRVDSRKQYVLRWDQETFDTLTYLSLRLGKLTGIKGRWTKAATIRYALSALREYVKERIDKEKINNDNDRSG